MTQEVNYDLEGGAKEFPAFRLYQDSIKIQVYFEDLDGSCKLSIQESTEETGDYATIEDSIVTAVTGTTSVLFTVLNLKRNTYARVAVSNIEATGIISNIVIKW